METITKETHIIYMTYDTTTGEYYIGLRSWRGDQEPNEYFGSYKKDSDWRPDKKNLVRITLAEYPDRETLKDEEVEWIRPHLGKPLCKNQHNNRLSFDNWGKNFTQETREKIRQSKLGKPGSMLGKNHTQESREKMSIGHKGKLVWNKGKTNVYSSETLEKIRQSKLGKPGTMLGKKHTKESREKMTQSRLGVPQPKVACCYCDRLIGNCNIASHQRACKKNPNRLQ